MLRTIDIDLLYQPPIDQPPPQTGNLYDNACRGDNATVNHWRDTWINNYKAAKDHFGTFADKSVGRLYGINKHKPAIVIGSGPSLKHSLEALKENAKSDTPVLTISCLHNFGFFEDEGIHADYYLTLDSGKIVLSDIYEGRKEKPEYYWEKTKGKKLLAIIPSDIELFQKWQGEIYLFNCMIPDMGVMQEYNKIERFAHFMSCGGNALGACMYAAKAIMGSNPIMYVGADFCFDYDNTFHSYKTHYDAVGNYVMWPDVYGIPRKTWHSYLNFKYWFDHIALTVPGTWISCSEGTLGAYMNGNLSCFKYMPLKAALTQYTIADVVYLEEREARTDAEKSKEPLYLKDLFANPNYEKDITLF